MMEGPFLQLTRTVLLTSRTKTIPRCPRPRKKCNRLPSLSVHILKPNTPHHLLYKEATGGACLNLILTRLSRVLFKAAPFFSENLFAARPPPALSMDESDHSSSSWSSGHVPRFNSQASPVSRIHSERGKQSWSSLDIFTEICMTSLIGVETQEVQF